MRNIILRISFIFILIPSINLYGQSCSSNIIYVDKNLIKDLTAWGNQNNSYRCSENVSTVTIDLNLMQEKDVPNWLSSNSKFIDFKKSFEEIEKIHHLSDNTIINLAENNFANGDSKKYSYEELKYYRDDYFDIDKMAQSEYYNNYKAIKRTFLFNNVKVLSREGFDEDYFCFSAPLLMAILQKHVASNVLDVTTEYDKCIFDFTIVEIINNGDKTYQAVLKFTYGNNSHYYDFSDEPSLSKKRMKQMKNENTKSSINRIKKYL